MRSTMLGCGAFTRCMCFRRHSRLPVGERHALDHARLWCICAASVFSPAWPAPTGERRAIELGGG